MNTRHLNQLYKAIKEEVDLPVYKIRHIVEEGQFKGIRDFLEDPPKALLVIPFLGRFRVKIRPVVHTMRAKLLPMLRRNPSNHRAKKLFRKLWRIRKEFFRHYYNSKPKYKNRFKQNGRNTNRISKDGNDSQLSGEN